MQGSEVSNMPIIFGIGHRARMGKDTVAGIIKEEFGKQYSIQVFPFAGALKREVNENALKSGGMHMLFSDGLRAENYGGFMNARDEIVPLPDWVTYDPHPPMDDPLCPLGKQRLLLQWWGMNFRRAVDRDYWVKKNAEYISQSDAEIVICPDMRFDNELDFCRKYGEAIKVHRPNFSSGVPDHPSETCLAGLQDEDWSAVILNDGTLEDLRERTVLVFESLLDRVPQ